MRWMAQKQKQAEKQWQLGLLREYFGNKKTGQAFLHYPDRAMLGIYKMPILNCLLGCLLNCRSLHRHSHPSSFLGQALHSGE
jgi:hypothetical protein